MFEFQADRRIRESILLRKWSKNVSDAEDNAYETPILTYNRELDVLVLANSITKSDVEEENSPPYLENVMTISKKDMTNLEDTTQTITPQSATNSNELNNSPIAPSSTQYVQKGVW